MKWGMCGEVGRAWQWGVHGKRGACIAEGHAWQGCVVGGHAL